MPVSAILQGENDLAPSEHLFGSSGGRRSYTLYQGHAGPVYSATFSPFGDFLLSSSSDSTSIIFSLFMFQFKLVLSVALLLKWIGLIYYSSTMEHEVKCKSCLLQRSQLPCMGCSGRNSKTFNACKKHLFPCSFRPVAPLSIIHSLSFPFLVFLQWMLSLSQLCIQLESLFMFTNKWLLFLENPFSINLDVPFFVLLLLIDEGLALGQL